MSPAALWESFTGKATALGASVQRASAAAAADLLADVDAVATCGVSERFPDVAARCRPAVEPGQAAPQVVAAGAFAVAETGSVLVREAAPDRAACYLAEHLWLLVPEVAIVPTLEQALEHLRALVASGVPYATFMSGPSRTADIERTLTIGVHGPRELTILVVEGEGPA